MKTKFTLPSWMTDPERFWQRVAAGLGILALALFLICCRLHGEITKYQTDLQELSKLNDNQRQFISQIGDGLGQVMTRLDKISEEQKNQPPMRIMMVPPSGENNETPALAHTLEADLNGDGIVDQADFELFTQSWDKTGEVAADFTKDGKVDWQDFQFFADQWMKAETWYVVKDNFSGAGRYANVQPVR